MSEQAKDKDVASRTTDRAPFVFPRWANYLLPLMIFLGVGGAAYVPTLVGYGLHADTLNVGYAPEQPIPFSHATHAGKLGMDCRYCHTTVERAGFAAVPPTQTCISCHTNIRPDSPQLTAMWESYDSGRSIDWVKVHDLPDHAYFNHAIHVNKGIGCVTCHGRVDTMDVVYQHENLSMSWCIDCHRNPEQHLRPRDQITNMTWDPVRDAGKTQIELGMELKQKYNVHATAYMTSCSTCHR